MAVAISKRHPGLDPVSPDVHTIKNCHSCAGPSVISIGSQASLSFRLERSEMEKSTLVGYAIYCTRGSFAQMLFIAKVR
jgi:hypothetical protein